MTEKERMLEGLLYRASDKELQQMHKEAQERLVYFNNPENYNKRLLILPELLAKVGKNCYIEPPLRMDYGINTHIGDNFYANFDLIILDVALVYIGSNVFIGPRVSLLTAGHPLTSKARNTGLEFGKEIHIGSNVWLGGNVVVNPGVTIGDNVVIGSGSVVTKDIPSNVIAVGNPCHVLRPLTTTDENYWNNLVQEYITTKE